MLAVLAIYAGIGLGLALGMLGLPPCRRRLERTAEKTGMAIGYARTVWLGGTIVAWPIGLYVLATGRLMLVDEKVAGTGGGGEAGAARTNRDEAMPGGGSQPRLQCRLPAGGRSSPCPEVSAGPV